MVGAVWLALWLIPVAVLVLSLGRGNVFTEIAIFFSKMAMVTFGGAYAVLAYVAQQAVEHYEWPKPGEMLEGLGMAETTPGPLIMVLQFVGFMAAFRDPGGMSPMLAGTLGGLLATWVTFTPCFLWILFGAPFVEAFIVRRGEIGPPTFYIVDRSQRWATSSTATCENLPWRALIIKELPSALGLAVNTERPERVAGS